MTADRRIVLDITEDERSYLAMHARYAASSEDDPRYWANDVAERARLKSRWLEIADVLHADPWRVDAATEGARGDLMHGDFEEGDFEEMVAYVEGMRVEMRAEAWELLKTSPLADVSVNMDDCGRALFQCGLECGIAAAVKILAYREHLRFDS